MKKICVLFYISIASMLYSQQDPTISLFWNNKSIFNPASTGLNNKHQASVNWRNQWEKVNGAPNTIIAGYQYANSKIHGGIGVNYGYETIGSMSNHKASCNYSYHLDFGGDRIFAIGTSLGFENIDFNPNFYFPDGVDDPLVPEGFQGNIFTPNIGIAYKTNKLFLGLSSTKFIESTMKNGFYRSARHLYFNADYLFNISSNFELKPQLLFATDFVIHYVDLNLLTTFKKNTWLAATYRIDNAFALMAGHDFKGKFRLAYCYEWTLSPLNVISKGSHEIALGFFLK
jgi:type IX secretion system PorP/SprF family membrane protein